MAKAIGKWISFGVAQSSNNHNTTIAPPPIEAPPIISPADAKQFGLENFGNTCYANSVLQALYFCGPFRELVVQYPDPSAPDIPLPPPAIPTPLPTFTSSQTHGRPKSGRKFSISDSPLLSTPTSQPSSAASALTSGSPSSLLGSIPIPPSPPTLLSALRSLYVHISKNPADRGTVAPRAFIDKLKELNELFRTSQHQDAHEFLNYMLNRIVEEMEDDRRNGNGPSAAAAGGSGSNTAASPSGEDLSQSIATISTAPPASTSTTHPSPVFPSTLVHRLFEGVLTSETRCLTCETVSSRDECFLDLSIDIEQNSSVTACLRQFSASEMLCQRNKFFCDGCCGLQEAEKRMKIKKLPNVLALHLKRFKYQEDVGRYIKLAYRVAFPFQLRLFNTVDDAEDPDRLYELFAIVVHIGNGPHHGHYVSIVKARGTWYLFDDDNVEVIKESDIARYYGDSNSGSAYVLYYQAVDLDDVALGVRPSAPVPPSTSAPTTSFSPLHTSVLSDIPSSLSKNGGVTPSTIHQTSGLEASSPSSYNEVEPLAPALPPGLITSDPEDMDTHDSSMSPTPIAPTPTLPAAASPIPRSSLTVSIPVPPDLPIDSVPSPSTPTMPPSTPGGSSTNSRSGFFHSLRHTQSVKGRINGSSAVKELPPPMPTASSSRRPATSSATSTSTAESTDAFGGLPHFHANSSQPIHIPNGKEKEREPERKSSTWFSRRKSVRTDMVSTSASASPPPLHASISPPQSLAPSSFAASTLSERSASSSGAGESAPWYKTAGRLGRRASETAFLAGHREVPSSVPSSPRINSPPHSHATLPPSSLSTSVPSPQLYAVPEYKKSTPELSPGTSKRGSTGRSRLPPRPSTAGATVGRDGSSRRPKSAIATQSRPPLPSLPGSPLSPALTNGKKSSSKDEQHPTVVPSNDGFSHTHVPGEANGNALHDNAHHSGPRQYFHHPRPLSSSSALAPSLGFSTSNATSSTLSTGADTHTKESIGPGSPPSTSMNLKKRASRKLSFTAPILGFGRSKDKDKHKDRDTRRPATATFPSSSTR